MRRKGVRVLANIKIKKAKIYQDEEEIYVIEIMNNQGGIIFNRDNLESALRALIKHLRYILGVKKKKTIIDKLKTLIIARGSTWDD